MEQRNTWQFGVVLALAWSVLLFLFLPIFITIPLSFTPKRYLSLATDTLSWRHYIKLFTSEDWLSSIWQSTVIAATTTVLAVVLGTLAAIGLWRITSRLSEIMRGFMLMPIIVPPIVSALAFYRMWIDLKLLDSYFGMILAHTILAAPYVVITVSTSLANFDLKLEQASRGLGASMGQTLRYVILPAIAPGVLAGAVFAFIISWDEIVVTLFITSRHIFTLPRRIWDGIREHVDPTVAAVASVLIMLTMLAIMFHMIHRRGERFSHRG